MELALNEIKFINNKLNIKVECQEPFSTINRIDLLEFNGTIIKTFTHVGFNNGNAVLSINKIIKGNYLVRIRDPRGTDILKLEI